MNNDPAAAVAALPPLREVIARHGLAARRGLGQNFILDLNLTRRIVRAAGDLRDVSVVEVGPGPGGLTRALVESGARRIIAVETDPRCLAALEPLVEAAAGRLEVHHGDALRLDLSTLAPAPRIIIANLPYNVATPLLIGWLRQGPVWDRLVLMFQREVAMRLASPPGNRTYGRLSVLAQWLAEVQLLFDVDASAFVPRPAITSTVVRLTMRPAPLAAADPEVLQRVTAAAFGGRRKMLRRSLSGLVAAPTALLESLAIDPQARAESLSVEQFCALARRIEEMEKKTLD
ncbi:MAG: 16S rRNA (adenine(1518)-N(6)/adenine(1519)-N(6))-dimethyltransferase RsmA [Alphaproteobacteria bacterium]